VNGLLPCIVAVGTQWTVYVDGSCLLSKPVSSYIRALEAWYSTFWVFSVEYPQTMCNCCMFIEKYCVGRKITVPGVVKRLGEKVTGIKRIGGKSAGSKPVTEVATE